MCSKRQVLKIELQDCQRESRHGPGERAVVSLQRGWDGQWLGRYGVLVVDRVERVEVCGCEDGAVDAGPLLVDVYGQRNRLVPGIDDLEIDRTVFLHRRAPEQRVKLALRSCDRHTLRAPIVRPQPLLPITRARNSLVGICSEADHIRRPVIPIPIHQARRITSKFANIRIPLEPQLIHALPYRRHQLREGDMHSSRIGEVNDTRGGVDLVDAVLSKKDVHVGVVGCCCQLS